MPNSYLLAIDQGTTGSTALVVAPDGSVLARANREFPQHFPSPAWVEHEPEEIWASVQAAVRAALASSGVEPSACAAIGITNQRETTLLWERDTGKAVHRAIVWQDRRTTERCAELKSQGLEPLFRQRTGLVLDPYFSGTKLEWLLDNVPGARKRAEAGELAFGTVDSFLLHRLTGRRVHATDVTNASRTLLFDLRTLAWDEGLLGHLRDPARRAARGAQLGRDLWPHQGLWLASRRNSDRRHRWRPTRRALWADLLRARRRQVHLRNRRFLVGQHGNRACGVQARSRTTLAWRIGDRTEYALEGSAFIAGAAVQWLRDGLGIISSADEIEALASQVDSAGDVVFVSALAGLGAPYWDPDARGLISGITRDTTKAHLARATLEGIAFQVADLAQAMEADMGRPLSRLRVDGGASRNEFLMKFQGDILGVPVERPSSVETTALGAAYLAGLTVGFFNSREAIARAHRIDWGYKPTMSLDRRTAHKVRWARAVARARSELGL